MRKYVRSIAAALITCCNLHPDMAIAAASRDLWGKSIVMRWTEVSQVYRERNPKKGNNFERQLNGFVQVYISDRGRLFGEARLQGERGRRHNLIRGSSEQSPEVDEDEGVNNASPWHWQIREGELTATRMFTQGASRLEASIQNDGSCQLRIMMGKEDGKILRAGGRRKTPEQVLSSETRDGSCQVIQGNVLAQ